jgi:hypothetical protein
LLDEWYDLHPAPRAQQSVDAWDTAHNFVAVALRQAAGCDQALVATLAAGQVSECGDALFLGGVEEPARIDNEQVSRVWIGG